MEISGERWRLGHRPALDGLRGIAVLLVVASHAFAAVWMRPIGGAGVVVFFVLSGFLITSLLADQHSRTGGLNLSQFYLRRALRLAPALLALVFVVATVALFVGDWWTTPGSIGAALSWTTNWFALGSGHGVALGHTWSLSIEEQFYLFWPLVLLVLLRLPWAVQAAVLVGWVAVATVLPFALVGGAGMDRVYYGTDTRTLPLVAGSVLALAMRRRVGDQARGLLAVAGVCVVVSVAVAWHGAVAILLTPQVVTAATVLIIWAIAQGTGVGWISQPWLVMVGRRSYGLYLWHVPVLAFGHHYGLSGLSLAAVGLPVSVALTAASWRYVEAPMQRLGRSGQVTRKNPDAPSRSAVPFSERTRPMTPGVNPGFRAASRVCQVSPSVEA